MKTYQYTPLIEDEIRLVTLPSKASGITTISIRNATLSEDETPNHEALSYAWDSHKGFKPIEVQFSNSTPTTSGVWTGRVRKRKRSDIGCPIRFLQVTKNLACALEFLKLPNEDRVLWIDAISINRQDPMEKGHQVASMASIYKSATRVVVWLGPSTCQLATGLKVISHLASMIEVDFEMVHVTPAPGQAARWADANAKLPYDDKTWAAIQAVLECSWFERLWIWQEIHASPETAIVSCGLTTLDWARFRKAVYCIFNKILSGGEDAPGLGRNILIRSYGLCSPLGQRRLDELLYRTQDAKCSDPRDRIYSLLAFCAGYNDFRIEPDYTKPYNEVHKDATRDYTRATQQLGFLDACNLHDHSEGFPSWVRNWSQPGKRSMLPRSHASLYSKADIVFRESHMLDAVGVEVATIETLDVSSATFSEDLLETGDFLQEVARPVADENPGSTLENGAAEVLLRTLCCNEFLDAYHPAQPGYPDFQDLKVKLQRRRLDEGDTDTEPIIDTDHCVQELSLSERLFKQEFDAYSQGRALVQTSLGQIGLGPNDAQSGDRVCVLLGSDNPLVLRPLPNGSWLVVGPCYVHALMVGEALLGPLPAHIRPVKRVAPGNFNCLAFVDQRSGNLMTRDPRAWALPAGWALLEHDMQEYFELYVNNETGEEAGFDPRLTTAALRDRGVPVKTFKLV